VAHLGEEIALCLVGGLCILAGVVEGQVVFLQIIKGFLQLDGGIRHLFLQVVAAFCHGLGEVIDALGENCQFIIAGGVELGVEVALLQFPDHARHGDDGLYHLVAQKVGEYRRACEDHQADQDVGQ